MENKDIVEIKEELMTSQEAVQAFTEAGLSEPTFRRRVRAGQIKSILPAGRQRGARYPKSQVLAAISNENGKVQQDLSKPKLKGATFTKMKPEDMILIAPIIEEAFGNYPQIERWSSLIAKNPDIGYILISEGKAVACGFIMPLTEEKILDIFSKEVTPPTFPEEIQEYQEGVEYYLYARTIAVTQKEISNTQSRLWGSLLIRNLMRTVLALASRGIVIKKIYGRSDTPQGFELMHGMGFTQIRTSTTHKNFVIDVETSGLDIILQYEKILNQWRKKHLGDLI
jgi:hypothetical protein